MGEGGEDGFGISLVSCGEDPMCATESSRGSGTQAVASKAFIATLRIPAPSYEKHRI